MRLGVKWTNLSRRQIAKRMKDLGTPVSRDVVSQLLKKHGYRRRKALKKKTMGPRHPDRNAQFENIARLKKKYLKLGLPVISIDTKKKELMGNFYRDGVIDAQETIKTNDHDFGSAGAGTVIPHGIYDPLEADHPCHVPVPSCWVDVSTRLAVHRRGPYGLLPERPLLEAGQPRDHRRSGQPSRRDQALGLAAGGVDDPRTGLGLRGGSPGRRAVSLVSRPVVGLRDRVRPAASPGSPGSTWAEAVNKFFEPTVRIQTDRGHHGHRHRSLSHHPASGIRLRLRVLPRRPPGARLRVGTDPRHDPQCVPGRADGPGGSDAPE